MPFACSSGAAAAAAAAAGVFRFFVSGGTVEVDATFAGFNANALSTGIVISLRMKNA